MKYFSKAYIDFFKGLGANNNRDWFNANKTTFISEVKEPFEKFVEDLIKAMKKRDKNINMTPKEAIFRIYRDIRFSKDKTPYKVKMTAMVSSGGKKDYTTPGIYIEFGPEDCRLYSGLYELSKDQLYDVRTYIAGHMKQFDSLINDKTFKKRFGELRGEKHKRLPKEFVEAAEKQPLLFNKNFYFFAKFKPSILTKSDLLDTYLDYYDSTKKLRNFMTKALG